MRPLAPLVLACALSIGTADARAQTSKGDAMRFLALGDSYTIGEGVDSASRWPVQLAKILRSKKINVGDPEIVARTGWTTDELASGITVASPGGPYALVSLLIGVNNQYRGRDAEKYRAEFQSLLAQAVEFADGKSARVVVLSIPDWGVTPFASGRDRAKIGSEIDRFNEIAKSETVKAGAHWVDVTPVSREENARWYGADGLHPTGAQYAIWAQLAVDAATAALKH